MFEINISSLNPLSIIFKTSKSRSCIIIGKDFKQKDMDTMVDRVLIIHQGAEDTSVSGKLIDDVDW